MNRNFIKIALRYLWRNKTYSILNFICLTFGLTCTIVAVLHINNTLSFDKFHKNYNRLYSVEAYVTYFNGDKFPKQYLSSSLTDVLKTNAPEIEEMTRVAERDFDFVSADKTFHENGLFADNNFFNVFSFPLLHGNEKVLSDLNSMAISENMALKLFETTDCVGKTVILKNGPKEDAFTVSGVFRRIPRQSVMQFDFVIPFNRFLADNAWASETSSSSNLTWALLKENANSQMVEAKIKNLIKTQDATLNQELFLFPLKDKNLYSYAAGKRVWREMRNVVIVGSVGFAILLIACFNFINLAIALNIRRYREAGIKKVSGSGKSGIVFQFLGETMLLTLISLISAILLVKVLLPGFNTMFHNDIRLNLLDAKMLLFFISVIVFTSLASGLLPALYLASSNPINVLKGKLGTSHSYSKFRQSLIVFQFVIPIILIISMMVIKTQDKYMREFDLGVDKDKLVILNNTENLQKHADAVKSELQAIPEISAVSYTNCIPARGTRPTSEVSWEGKDASEKLHFWCINADFDYNKAVTINTTDGRFFNPSFPSDSAAYMINDVAANVMKYKNPVGSQITVEGKKGVVIGVFKDFHAIDLAGPIVPTIIRIKPQGCNTLLIRYASGNFPTMADNIRKVFRKYEPEAIFQPVLYRDLASYSNLSMPSNLVGLAFIIALALACMGMFGLASFTSESRTKEIGIRKANGATTRSVVRLLLSSYTKWLAISMVVATPFAFLLGKIFLGGFYFRTAMPMWAFILGPAIAAFVALSTVSSQTWSAASRNPVKSLRYE
jgi:ABC-type antimicrobial peptide transport system permease subunit